MTRRTMLLTNTLEAVPSGGRALLCKLNYDVLQAICSDRLVTVELPRQQGRIVSPLRRAVAGWIDGLDAGTIQDALTVASTSGVEQIFVDGSNLGAFTRAARRSLPGVRVITFFHNVESVFFASAFRHNPTIHSAGVVLANFLAERASVKHSDTLICLTESDSRLLKRIHGKGASHIVPMALSDRLPSSERELATPAATGFALFVGGGFYANRVGASWFAEHVAPRLQIPTRIVGKGFEKLKHDLERNRNVEVIGGVDDLYPWYRGAAFVVAPIFDGSGMKTKVAEALMFGKRIIGTGAAFAGYESIAEEVGRVCNSADEFVVAIGRELEERRPSFDAALRSVYEAHYSESAHRQRLNRILNADQ